MVSAPFDFDHIPPDKAHSTSHKNFHTTSPISYKLSITFFTLYHKNTSIADVITCLSIILSKLKKSQGRRVRDKRLERIIKGTRSKGVFAGSSLHFTFYVSPFTASQIPRQLLQLENLRIQPGDAGDDCAQPGLVDPGLLVAPLEVRIPLRQRRIGAVAQQGDVIYAVPGTFHSPQFWGKEGLNCRLTNSTMPSLNHLYDAK